MAIIEHTEARYDVREVEMGEVYTWCSESVMVKCDCGERPTLTASTTTCEGCGADHEVMAREGLTAEGLKYGALHPWRH